MPQPSLIVDRCSLHLPKASTQRSSRSGSGRHPTAAPGVFSWLRVKHGSSFQRAPRAECALGAVLTAAVVQPGIPSRRIQWSCPRQADEEALGRLLDARCLPWRMAAVTRSAPRGLSPCGLFAFSQHCAFIGLWSQRLLDFWTPG